MKRKVLFFLSSILLALMINVDANAQRIYVDGTDLKVNGSEIFLNGTNTPWRGWNDFGIGRWDYSWWDTEFKKLADNGINSTRVWISCNGEGNPLQLTAGGYVNGPTQAFLNDVDDLVEIAAKHKVYLMVALASFDHTIDGNPYYDRWRAMYNSQANMNSFVENYALLLAKRYNNNPYFFAIDVVNEIMWVTDSYNNDRGNYPWSTVQYLVGKTAQRVHEETDVLVCVSNYHENLSPSYSGNKWSNAAIQSVVNDPDAYVDFYKVHFYSWVHPWFGGFHYDQTPAQRGYGDKPAITGEISAQGGYKDIPGGSRTYDHSCTEYYIRHINNNWSGCMPWTSNGVDSHGSLNGGHGEATRYVRDNYYNLVYPSPNSCTVSLSKSTHDFGSGAGSTNVTVTTSESYSVSDNQSWISTSTSGSTVTISVTENTSTSSRSGTVTITGCETKTISVSQAGATSTCTVSLSASSKSFNSAASSSNVTVTTSESYSVSDNQSWISTSTSGSTVTISVTENTSNSSRSGTVTITGCQTKTISVSQQGTDSPAQDAISITSSPATATAGQTITVSVDYEAESTADRVRVELFKDLVNWQWYAGVQHDITSPASGSHNFSLTIPTSLADGDYKLFAVIKNGSTDIVSTSADLTVGDVQTVQYTLTTTATTGGSVTAGGTYNEGTSVQITATENSGYTFTGWSGDASGTTNPLSVTMDANKSITANFEADAPVQYTLTTSATAGGSVTAGGTYNEGTSVQITATEDDGYTFTGWSGDASGTANPLSVTMDADKSITANFTEDTPPTGSTITVRARLLQNGPDEIELWLDDVVAETWTVSSTSYADFTYEASGEHNVKIYFQDNSGNNADVQIDYIKVGSTEYQAEDQATNTSVWQGQCGGSYSENMHCPGYIDFGTINFGGTVTPTYTLTTTATAGGSVTAGGTYDEGASVQITATENSGYTFTGWSGDASGTANPLSVTMNSNKSITANFEENPVNDDPARYEAEDAALTGVSVASSVSGYSGTGYINASSFDNTGDKISFTVNVSSSGSYDLTIGYNNQGLGQKYQDVYINGTKIGNIHFPESSGWGEVTLTDKALNAGNNTVEIRKSWGWMHVDYLDVSGLKSATESLTVTELVVFPNPVTNGILNIQANADKTNVSIYNMQGKLVLKQAFNQQTIQLNISDFNSGMYILNVNGQNEKFVVK